MIDGSQKEGLCRRDSLDERDDSCGSSVSVDLTRPKIHDASAQKKRRVDSLGLKLNIPLPERKKK